MDSKGKIFKTIAVITLIPGILIWFAGITAFLFRLFTWYKTDQWTKLAIIEFIPNRLIVELTTNFPRIQKELYWILNREIILISLGLGLILIVGFLVMNGSEKRDEEQPNIVSERLKKLTRNE